MVRCFPRRGRAPAHPHDGLVRQSGQAYLSKEGIRQIKSKLNDIFRNEMLHLYEQKSDSRDELVRETRRAMLELVRAMQDGVCDHPDAEQLMLELAAQLGAVKGKKSYGYLPKRLKPLVDEIVDEMERLPVVASAMTSG
ncbi:MAG: relaxase MobL [Oscillospiraceae bacterium]